LAVIAHTNSPEKKLHVTNPQKSLSNPMTSKYRGNSTGPYDRSRIITPGAMIIKRRHIIHAAPKIIAVAKPSLIESTFISLSVDFE
jgi:hypothetical protein